MSCNRLGAAGQGGFPASGLADQAERLAPVLSRLTPSTACTKSRCAAAQLDWTHRKPFDDVEAEQDVIGRWVGAVTDRAHGWHPAVTSTTLRPPRPADLFFFFLKKKKKKKKDSSARYGTNRRGEASRPTDARRRRGPDRGRYLGPAEIHDVGATRKERAAPGQVDQARRLTGNRPQRLRSPLEAASIQQAVGVGMMVGVEDGRRSAGSMTRRRTSR